MSGTRRQRNQFVTEVSKTKADMDDLIRRGDQADGGRTIDNRGEVDICEHKMSVEEVCEKLHTDLQKGLNATERAARKVQYGMNQLTPPPVKPWWCLLLEQFLGIFNLLLEGAAILCLCAYAIDPAAVDYLYIFFTLVFVVTATGTFSFYQEYRSAAIMASFQNYLPENTLVVIDGVDTEVPSIELYPGDIVKIKQGDRFPADLRVFTCANLTVDNSSLTGESDAQKRTTENEHENAIEATNLCFFGTTCSSGNMGGIVIKTADSTLIGTIANLASGTEKAQTPINIEIHHFINIVSGVAIFLGVSFLCIQLARGAGPIETIVFCIGIIIANVPEGLLATVTVSLSLTAQKMAKKSVLVKNLEAVETLGSTTCIASDKTGTLTQNRMTVVELYFDNETTKDLTGNEIDDTGGDEMLRIKDQPSFKACIDVMSLCNNAVFHGNKENLSRHILQRKTDGDASESAMLKFVEPVLKVQLGSKGQATKEYRDKYPKVAEIPFSSANKYQVSVHNMGDGVDPLLVMKGAPEKVFNRCTKIMDEGKIVDITEEHEAAYNKNRSNLMFKGRRVLGMAIRHLPKDQYPNTKDETVYDDQKKGIFGLEPIEKPDLVFVGLMALVDPPRPSVPRAVMSCKDAGVKVIMVTGDHPDTAEAIARQCHIIKGETQRDVAKRRGVDPSEIQLTDPDVKALVIKGTVLATLSEQQLDDFLDYDEIVFARTTPAQKLKIVEGLQRKTHIRRNLSQPKPIKHVVAVTGDGVNDSPALKAADIGVAMGISGTTVAQDAADMILLDDNFASIVQGVEEGRLIFDNLKKSIAYTLSSNIPEISPFLIFILAKIPCPLHTVLILLIDLVTDMIPAISLAYEDKEADIMMKPPRDSRIDRLVTGKLVSFSYLQIGIVQAAAGFFVYVMVLKDYGFLPGDLSDHWWAYVKPGLAPHPVLKWDCDVVGRPWDTYDPEGNASFTKDFWFRGDGIWRNLEGCMMQGKDDMHPEYVDIGTMGQCYFDNIRGGFQDRVCWEPAEALIYAQTSYFISIIIVQWADIMACKTRILSLKTQGMRNKMLNMGLCSETMFGALFSNVWIFNIAFLTRPISLSHWCSSLPFCVWILIYDEIRKYLMRNMGKDYDNWLYKYTYY